MFQERSRFDESYQFLSSNWHQLFA